MQGLWLSMGRIDEVWMCRAEVSGELVQSVVSNKDTGRDVQHAVFSIATFRKYLAKVTRPAAAPPCLGIRFVR